MPYLNKEISSADRYASILYLVGANLGASDYSEIAYIFQDIQSSHHYHTKSVKDALYDLIDKCELRIDDSKLATFTKSTKKKIFDQEMNKLQHMLRSSASVKETAAINEEIQDLKKRFKY